MEFTWDENKNKSNLKKHGIDFESAAFVFLDDNRLVIYDYEHSVDEDRYIVIGKYINTIYVVYTLSGDIIRIISARKATKKEKKLYESALYNR